MAAGIDKWDATRRVPQLQGVPRSGTVLSNIHCNPLPQAAMRDVEHGGPLACESSALLCTSNTDFGRARAPHQSMRQLPARDRERERAGEREIEIERDRERETDRDRDREPKGQVKTVPAFSFARTCATVQLCNCANCKLRNIVSPLPTCLAHCSSRACQLTDPHPVVRHRV